MITTTLLLLSYTVTNYNVCIYGCLQASLSLSLSFCVKTRESVEPHWNLSRCPESYRWAQDTLKKNCRRSLSPRNLCSVCSAARRDRQEPPVNHSQSCKSYMNAWSAWSRVKNMSNPCRSPASRIRVGEIELIAGCGRVKIPWMDDGRFRSGRCQNYRTEVEECEGTVIYSPSFYRSAKKKKKHVNEMDDSEVYFHVSCIGGG